MPEVASASFSRSRASEVVRPERMGEGGFEDTELAKAPPVEVVARYAEDDLLMSGWAIGETKYLGGKPALLRVRQGEGHVVLLAFRPQQRGQPRGTYKLIFNALYGAPSRACRRWTRCQPIHGLQRNS